MIGQYYYYDDDNYDGNCDDLRERVSLGRDPGESLVDFYQGGAAQLLRTHSPNKAHYFQQDFDDGQKSC